MLLIAELAHQRDPYAIAEIICQELQPLGIVRPNVSVNIVDGILEVQILTDSAIDKEKLLTLVRGKFQDLRIESVKKFSVHCWHNDEEMHEQRLLWTEQFMLDLPKALPEAKPELDDMRSPETGEPETREPEPQLSKDSVLQQAIKKISPTSYDEKINSLAPDFDKQPTTNNRTIASDAMVIANKRKFQSSIDSNYWQLLLVGVSIILLGLGIGASVRAITTKNIAKEIVEPSLPISSPNPSVGNRVKSSTNSVKVTPSQISETDAVTSPISPKVNLSSPETITPNLREEGQVITLEKFNRIQKGMSIEQVEKVFGVSGNVIAENSSNSSVGRVYSWKNLQGSNAIVEFKDGQVVAKAQAGL